jgi:hypothetical protein
MRFPNTNKKDKAGNIIDVNKYIDTNIGWCLTFVGVYISHKKHDQYSCFREVYVMVDYVDKIT